MSAAVLSTDMGSHQGLVAQFAASRAERPDLAAWGRDAGVRALLLRFLLHAADLCNPCRPAPLGTVWGERVCCEFLAQARDCCLGRVRNRLGFGLRRDAAMRLWCALSDSHIATRQDS